jgi:flavorubredoxin
MSKKRICSVICIIGVAALIVTAVIVTSLNSVEIVRALEIQNPDGTTGTVFVVFRPGLTGFNEGVVNEYVRGLVGSDWRVEVTTCSSQTPTNVTGYDLIVLGSPVNGGQPHAAMLDYLSRVDLLGKPVVLILTSGGIGGTALDYFKNVTIAANGVVLSTMQFTIFESDAGSRAYTAGTEISLPP